MASKGFLSVELGKVAKRNHCSVTSKKIWLATSWTIP